MGACFVTSTLKSAVPILFEIGDYVMYRGETVSYTHLEPKKVIGGLFMRSEDRQTALVLPNVEGYSNFVSEQDKPGYFNVSVSPLNDAKGASIYILRKKVSE